MLHASAVAVAGAAVLITGPSGSGKSALALELMALGATLVADDRVIIRREGDRLWCACPDTISGRIEARGVGILNAPTSAPVPLALVIRLDESETERLPQRHQSDILGVSIPALRTIPGRYFPAAIMQVLKHGRSA